MYGYGPGLTDLSGTERLMFISNGLGDLNCTERIDFLEQID
jgi:hypothetical protein